MTTELLITAASKSQLLVPDQGWLEKRRLHMGTPCSLRHLFKAYRNSNLLVSPHCCCVTVI